MRLFHHLPPARGIAVAVAILCMQPLFSQLSINSFSPVSGPVGATVTIRGSNFGAAPASNTVYFGSAKAVVTAASSNQLTVTVPAGASYEPVTVTANGLTAYSSKAFNVTFTSGGFINQRSFRSRTDSVLLNSSIGPYGLVIKDFDGDGKNDVMAVNGEYQFYVLKNTSSNGSISFASKQTFFNTAAPYNGATGDFDGDGKPDLAIANYLSGDVTIQKNTSIDGNISFTLSGKYPVGTGSTTVGISDFDSDGKPDIIAGGSSVIKVYKNTSTNGSISFTLALDEVRSGAFIVNDLDNDGKPEIVVRDNANTKIEILKNTSTGSVISFAVSQAIPGNNLTPVSLNDVTGDGKPDLIITKSGSGFFIYKNTGSADNISFASPVNVAVQSGYTGAVCPLTDVDGDGRPDLVYAIASLSTISVLKNTGTDNNVSFAEPVSYYSRASSYVAAADIDGDGKPDVIVGNQGSAATSSISILKNQSTEPKVVASGTNPVSGNIHVQVAVDSTVEAFNGQRYVQRHYDIEPESNASTSTATLTLLFTQQDFNNYNSTPHHGMNLPADPSDNAGKAALRIWQQHGLSTTGLPGSYSGNQVDINPEDDKIVWNETAQCWEVTFDVVGFSGFFINTPANTTLPVKIISFAGSVVNQKNKLNWTSSNETGFGFYELQRSTDGLNFVTVSRVLADQSVNPIKNYAFTDTSAEIRVYYYRLKAVDRDGSFTYSEVIKLTPAVSTGSLAISPNPARERTTIRVPFVEHNAQLSILDMTGKCVRRVNLSSRLSQYILPVTGVPKGTYKLVWSDGSGNFSKTLVIE